MRIDRLDHLVLTVRDMDATIEFYERALGMRALTFGPGRRALAFGRQKINLHPAAAPFGRHALHPIPGSADLCFVASGGIAEVVAHLQAVGVPLEEGPVLRSGALGPITSVYLRDPDRNLVEVSCYEAEGSVAGA